jgi:hypothetical protein
MPPDSSKLMRSLALIAHNTVELIGTQPNRGRELNGPDIVKIQSAIEGPFKRIEAT